MTEENKSKLDEMLGKLTKSEADHFLEWSKGVDEFVDSLTPEEKEKLEREVTLKEESMGIYRGKNKIKQQMKEALGMEEEEEDDVQQPF